MALSDHFKGLRVEFEIAKEEEEPRELLDLSLKEGQTIKVGKFIRGCQLDNTQLRNLIRILELQLLK
jgi:hypothetical protein